MPTYFAFAPKFVGKTDKGLPAVGYKVFTYLAGTDTKSSSYTGQTGGTANANPVVLDARGECDLWLDTSIPYRILFCKDTEPDPPVNCVWSINNYKYRDLSPCVQGSPADVLVGVANYQLQQNRGADLAIAGIQGGGKVWTPWGDGVNNGIALLNFTDGSVLQSWTEGVDYSAVLDIISGIDRSNNAIIFDDTDNRLYRFNTDGTKQFIVDAAAGLRSYGIFEEVSGNLWTTLAGGGNYECGRMINDWVGHTGSVTSLSGTPSMQRFFRNADYIAGRVYGVIATTGALAYANTTTMTLTTLSSVGASAPNYPGAVGTDGYVYIITTADRVLRKLDKDGNEFGSYTIPTGIGGTNTDWPVFYDSQGFIWTTKFAGGHPLYQIKASTMTLQNSFVTEYRQVIGEPTAGTIALAIPAGDATYTYGKLGKLVVCPP